MLVRTIYARPSQLMQSHPKAPKMPFHGGNAGSNPAGDAKKETV